MRRLLDSDPRPMAATGGLSERESDEGRGCGGYRQRIERANHSGIAPAIAVIYLPFIGEPAKQRHQATKGERPMPFIDTSQLQVEEPLPGWNVRFFHSENMLFAYYAVSAGASIHEHSHPNEEVWHVI